MGIEAFCPNGHRTKVKDRLAGRVGICPTCGARFRVPDLRSAEPSADVPAASSPEVFENPPKRLPTARLLPLDADAVRALPMALPYEHAELPQAFASGERLDLDAIPLPVPPFPGFSFPEPSSAPLRSAPVSPPEGRSRGPIRPALRLLIFVAVVVAAGGAAAAVWQILRGRGLLR